jgi:sugar O-acyltransferase (sialic acid O-acetyltransferase NeuD family)
LDLERSAKYALDRVSAWFLLLLLSPLGALLAAAIRIESPGSPLVLQERVGAGGHLFTIFRFRLERLRQQPQRLSNSSATPDAADTRVGAWLRRTRLVALPQLLNVALGEMSFVGPRPASRQEVEHYTPRQRRRLLFRPGITGWARVQDLSTDGLEAQIEHDLHYVDHFSWSLDAAVLWRTVTRRRAPGFVPAPSPEPGEVGSEVTAAQDWAARIIAASHESAIAVATSEVAAGEQPATPAGTPDVAAGSTPARRGIPVDAPPRRVAEQGASAATIASAARPATDEPWPVPALDFRPWVELDLDPDPAPALDADARETLPVAAPKPEPLPVLVIGAGGHARVAIDVAEKQGRYRVVGLIDDRPALAGTDFMGYPVLGGREVLRRDDLPAHAFVAIGAPRARETWQKYLEERGVQMATLVHPSAQVGREVVLGGGSVLMAGAIVNSGSRIGRGVIVNTAASVDHDCEVGDFAHIAPGARLAGGVRVGARAHVGIGSCVIQNLGIGNDAVVGAGAAVVRAVPAGVTVVGVPARPLAARVPEPAGASGHRA